MGGESAASGAGASGADASGGSGGQAAGGSGGQAGGATGGSSGAGLSYADMVLSDGPSLYWRELAGTASLVDVSPKHNDGNYVGCVEPAEIGTGPIIHLCGGYLQAGDIFDFADIAPFTFEAWIKPEPLQLSRFARIVGKETPITGPRRGWDLIMIDWGQDAGTPSLGFERWGLVDGSGSSSGVIVENPTILSNSFTHVAITYDSARCRIYLNGVAAMENVSSESLPDTNGTFRIGADPFGAEPNWRGDIDEIAVYEKALLPDRVAAHYDQGKAEGR
jgi:hypothetical protein